MLRVSVACLLVAVFAFSPAAASVAQAQEHAVGPPREKVYLFRGFTNVLSPGIDQLADDLRKRNISTTIANHAFATSVASEAIGDCRSGRVGTIVVIGHSFGATAALMMAERLRQAGMRVALIVTLDPVIKGSVPANVHRLENYYVSNGVGTTVQRGDHFHGSLTNVDLKSNSDLGHISLTTLPSMQKQVLHDVLAANTSCR